ncbi:MAG: DUF1289 domain-containing protein [Bacteroidales bacterium]|nr:DUF1289 domain-containing protein [Bacteroidales bacterium]
MTASPCSHVCTRDLNNICLGCFRSMDEIRDWWKFPESKKQQVIKNTEKRKTQKDEADSFAH